MLSPEKGEENIALFYCAKYVTISGDKTTIDVTERKRKILAIVYSPMNEKKVKSVINNVFTLHF